MKFNTKGSPFKKYETYDFTLDIWLKYWYPTICNYLDIILEEDVRALNTVIKEYKSNCSQEEIKKIIHNRDIYALGAGNNLKTEFDDYVLNTENKDNVLLSADGATTYAMSCGIVPKIIVTDLDGKILDQLKAQNEGAILAVHVHCDNIDIVMKNMSSICNGKFIITTQTYPIQGSYNFLGFTDGDREICLSTSLSARRIYLLGYDFGPLVGKFSKTYSLDKIKKEKKLKKFLIAKSVINWCTNSGQKIDFFRK
ncbi:MAG: 6-hydroxymethylpterin diphosphokinase MptE-like protein [Candidatus Thorarchaeota archaeon]